MREARSLNEVNSILRILQDRLDRLENRNLDLHGRKVTNAGKAEDSSDYVTLKQFKEELSKINPILGSAFESFIEFLRVRRLQVIDELKIDNGATDADIKPLLPGLNRLDFNINSYFNGAAYVLKDATKPGLSIAFAPGAASFQVVVLPVGGAPFISFAVDALGNVTFPGTLTTAGVAGVSGSVTLAKITAGGTNGLLSTTNGRVTTMIAPT